MASRARRVPLGRRTPGPSPPAPPQRTALGSAVSICSITRVSSVSPIARVFRPEHPRRCSHVGYVESSRALSRPRGGVSPPRHKYPLKANEKTLFAHGHGLHLAG